jgi:hypothetical protein
MARSGGGITSKNVVRKPVKTGERARKFHEAGVAQIGTSRGDHSTESGRRLRGDVEKVRGELKPAGGPGGVKLGNEVAKTTVCGPGGSRQVYAQGTQSMHGPANPGNPPERRPILSEFGPDSPNVAGRK